ncbi:NlpC/P60 family protein [Rummeliibacillus sp. NPDC094406]|uniref:C40 family peptidase n=1 Tax=Rummeliibacillus sp. NPDC094406 TaxID=3364511 RepID=UPI003806D5A6
MTALNNLWRCAVPVATIWTSPASARDIDVDGTGNPVNLVKWLEALQYKERLDLCEANRVQTQLLYGEEVIVDEIIDDWAKIVAIHQPSTKDQRGYPGWVPLTQLIESNGSESKKYAIITADKAQLWTEDEMPLLVLPFNTILPLRDESLKYYHVDTPNGKAYLSKNGVEITSSRATGNPTTMEQAVIKGTAFLDLPYFWGGMSSYGYDCSGFTYNMAKASGIIIPRDAGEQKEAGQAIDKENPDEWLIGDLLFFANDFGRAPVRHVGFYFGEGKMIHSPQTGKTVEIIHLTGTKFEEELCGVSRYQAELG